MDLGIDKYYLKRRPAVFFVSPGSPSDYQLTCFQQCIAGPHDITAQGVFHQTFALHNGAPTEQEVISESACVCEVVFVKHRWKNPEPHLVLMW